MKIEKHHNGYRVRKMYKGVQYIATFDHKPTQKEVIIALDEKMNQTKSDFKGGSFDNFAKKYIQMKENQKKPKISPSTIRGYESIVRNISDEFKNMNLYDITLKDIQNEVDEYSKTRSPKSTKNFNGFISSVFGEYRKDFNYSIKLPHNEKKYEYEPTTNDIKNIIEYSKGSEYYIAFQLATLGLRRGEICALKLSDLSKDNVLSITKDLVVDKNNNLIVTPPKTQESNRRIKIPNDLANEIRNKGYICKMYPNSITRYLHRVQDKLEIPRFRLHMFRHFCVAYLHKNGFTEEQIMQWGGWSTSHVMKNAYRYNLDPHESQKEISNKMSELF